MQFGTSLAGYIGVSELNTLGVDMHTVKQMQVAIGASVMVKCSEIWVACLVMDVKERWGHIRLLVRPVAGEGEMWVETARIAMPTATAPVACAITA